MKDYRQPSTGVLWAVFVVWMVFCATIAWAQQFPYPPNLSPTPTTCDAACVEKIVWAQKVDYLCRAIVSISGQAAGTAQTPGVAKKCVDSTVVQNPNIPSLAQGVVTYDPATGTITVRATSAFTRVEVLIDGRTSDPWYMGTRTFVNGELKWVVPAAVRDGKSHYIDVRLYKPPGLPDSSNVFRPDNHPFNVILAP